MPGWNDEKRRYVVDDVQTTSPEQREEDFRVLLLDVLYDVSEALHDIHHELAEKNDLEVRILEHEGKLVLKDKKARKKQKRKGA